MDQRSWACQVQWRAWSAEYEGGISSISETPGEIVQGAIYECTERELEKLDYIPGICVPQYMVLGEDDKWHSAELYRLWELKGPFPPSRIYVEGMLEGAKQIGLSPDYLEKIEKWLGASIVAESRQP